MIKISSVKMWQSSYRLQLSPFWTIYFILFQGLSTLQQTWVSWTLSLRKAAPPEIWKCYAILLDIYALSSNTNISLYLCVNLRTDLYSYWWKTNIQFISLVIVTWCLCSSSDMASDSSQRPTGASGGVMVSKLD